ncbi:amino acid ABC transporter substrate-binding protein [Devosia nitrariae]|uniref:Amino acid ABC transporter substrate-binding protein n=1 Tax=Devosia nitrariae TaxID=2071872 RepID=A0ABQ5WCY0_9HYPH|nr:amino acid ABC transporter substrate-binding protein [Devosia nitrariae]
MRAVGRALRVVAFVLIATLLAASAAYAQTLEAVRERGFLICGAVGPLAGFSQVDGEGRWSGFDIDICRALAAAVFGDPNKLEFRPLRGNSRFAVLQTGDVDVIVRNAPWTERRDTVYGASYVTPTFYDGQAFMVPQSEGVVSAFELDDLTICVADNGEELTRLREFFFENQASYSEIIYEDTADLLLAYRAGLCNVLSAAGRELNAMRRELGDPLSHRILPERISKEAVGPVVRAGDDTWFNIVKWTVFALINAEELGVTALNIDSLSATRTSAVRRLLGLDGNYGAPVGLEPDFMADVIRAVGNYGEIYERNFGPQTGAVLLRGQNSLWVNGGLLYAPPIR